MVDNGPTDFDVEMFNSIERDWRELHDKDEDEDSFCEHGLMFDEDCLACSAIYDDWPAGTVTTEKEDQ